MLIHVQPCVPSHGSSSSPEGQSQTHSKTRCGGVSVCVYLKVLVSTRLVSRKPPALIRTAPATGTLSMCMSVGLSDTLCIHIPLHNPAKPTYPHTHTHSYFTRSTCFYFLHFQDVSAQRLFQGRWIWDAEGHTSAARVNEVMECRGRICHRTRAQSKIRGNPEPGHSI